MAHVSDILSSTEEWFLDSCCAMHMTGKKGHLEKLKPHPESLLTFGDVTRRRIMGIGKFIIKIHLILKMFCWLSIEY